MFRSPPPCPQPGHYSRGDNVIDVKSDHIVFPFRIHVYEIYNPGGLASILAGDWLFNIICSMFVNKCQHCYEFFFWGNNSSTTFLFDVLKTKLSHESHKKKVAIYICLQVCIIARSNSKFNIYQNPSFWCKNLWHWECDFTIKYNIKHENLKEGTSPTTRSWELLSLQDLCKR